MTLSGSVTTPEALDATERGRMLALMVAHFEGVSPEAFQHDLEQKRWVIVLRDAAGELQGFTTIGLDAVEVEGRRIEAVFSGDTIVHRDHWGTTELAQAWGRFVLSLARADGEAPLYWFLISKGHRTYRFLPLYFQAYWPRHDADTPPFEADVMAQLAGARYPGCFDPEAGVLRFGGTKDRLRDELAEIPAGRLRDPAVRFFLERNPGYVHGDELVCLARLAPDNLTPAAWRVLRQAPGPEVLPR
ncbi:MAG: hypothetical protein VKS61_02950 [Candidatus Sericytochromatia bacterium]|nr:hypothetical protein [Candidatus Sericytochromatia bacterium]